MDRRSTASRAGGGTATLLVLVAVMGSAVAVLASRASHLVDRLPAAHVEPWIELLAVTVGLVAAAWIALSALLGTACVLARAAGRSWTAGERLVVRVAPQVVRRAARVGIGLSVGAGLVLGAGTAQAAEPPSPDAPPVVAVDLGWRPTTAGAGPEERADRGTADVSTSPDVTGAGTAPAGTTTDPAVGAGASGPGTAPSPTTTGPGGPSSEAAAEPAGSSAGQGGATSSTPSTATSSEAPSAVRDDATGTVPAQQTPPAPASAGAAQRDAALSVTREVPADPSGEVVVLRGDTLWSIAARHVPAGASDADVAVAVERWFSANAHVIGDDPDLILPGQVLTAPVA